MEKREALLNALSQLRSAHPALPQLRDFQVSPGNMYSANHNVSSWTSCWVHWMRAIRITSSALCPRALGRPCPCCCLVTSCLQVLEFQTWNSMLFICYRLSYNDPGASHHNRASASGGLWEAGLNCNCWQPGEHLKLPNTLLWRHCSVLWRLAGWRKILSSRY